MAIFPFTDPQGFGVVGGHANMEEWNAITRTASVAGIAPGQPVQRADDFSVEAWDGASAHIGIVRYTVDADTADGYPVGKSVSLMTEGVMYVAAGGVCTAGSQATYDAATDRWSDAGGDIAMGVEFDTSATGGAIVKIRINRPAPALYVAPVTP